MAKKPSTLRATLAEGTYLSTGAILHDGVTYAPGDVIADLSEADASTLLAAGVIEAAKTPAAAPAPEA
jgi:hypothetical protein